MEVAVSVHFSYLISWVFEACEPFPPPLPPPLLLPPPQPREPRAGPEPLVRLGRRRGRPGPPGAAALRAGREDGPGEDPVVPGAAQGAWSRAGGGWGRLVAAGGRLAGAAAGLFFFVLFFHVDPNKLVSPCFKEK